MIPWVKFTNMTTVLNNFLEMAFLVNEVWLCEQNAAATTICTIRFTLEAIVLYQ